VYSGPISREYLECPHRPDRYGVFGRAKDGNYGLISKHHEPSEAFSSACNHNASGGSVRVIALEDGQLPEPYLSQLVGVFDNIIKRLKNGRWTRVRRDQKRGRPQNTG